ncbi:DUF6584 family protein [Streptomyces sp. NPDC046860]|uniref:DUF6584 family protein n=1 Tax=Streptomyces sp. NPDC046860 TaxID=3154495 RepID=UPI0033E22635
MLRTLPPGAGESAATAFTRRSGNPFDRGRRPARSSAHATDGPESLAPTDLARERLAALRAECPEDGSGTETAGSSGKDFLPTAGCLLVALVLGAIWVNGFVALFD